MATEPEYDPRYLAGIDCFNRHEFFEAHEVWEELWLDCPSADRRFYQSLIQAAVALYHWSNGNARGTSRLFRSGRAYMSAYADPHRGLATGEFWEAMATAVAETSTESPPATGKRLDPRLVPRITLMDHENSVFTPWG